MLSQINAVIEESKYSSDSKGDYAGALCTRVRSLTNGLYSQIFTPDEIAPPKLFDENVIVDLSRTGSVETNCLLYTSPDGYSTLSLSFLNAIVEKILNGSGQDF